jgi:very-short-patch-repair endonuclease
MSNSLSDIVSQLSSSRQELLDLTSRNRLLNTSRKQSRSTRIEIVDESSQHIFDMLVDQEKKVDFLHKEDTDPPVDEDDGTYPLFVGQPDYDEQVEEDRSIVKSAQHLQTDLTETMLQKRLLGLYRDSENAQQEQGVNILYLATGFLKWYQDEKSDMVRYAPLVMIPVQLHRQSAATRFKLEYTGDEVATNLSLQAMLQNDFRIQLPDIPEDEEWDFADYFLKVSDAVASQSRWEVLQDDVVLWLFSFNKYLMYRDLDPRTWNGTTPLEKKPIISGMFGNDGFGNEPPLFTDSENIDYKIAPQDQVHVLNADSSQSIAIEEVRRGRNLVIQGPPGTGKSQTIANIIASAVKEGKRVLFVAEKMAALDVVKHRLENLGIGDICLELHSHKANKRKVLAELQRTLELEAPLTDDMGFHLSQFETQQDKLNCYVAAIHSPVCSSGITPYHAFGQLLRLQNNNVKPPSFVLSGATDWDQDEFANKRNLVQRFASVMEKMCAPSEHIWRGVGLESVMSIELNRTLSDVPNIINNLDFLIETSKKLFSLLSLSLDSLSAIDTARIITFSKMVINAPVMDRCCMGNTAWQNNTDTIQQLISTGKEYCTLHAEMLEEISEDVLSEDMESVTEVLEAIEEHATGWFRIFNGEYRSACREMESWLGKKTPKTNEHRIELLNRIIDIQKRHETLVSDETSSCGQQVFGQYWKGVSSDWDALQEIIDWDNNLRESNIPWEYRSLLNRFDDQGPIVELVTKLQAKLKPTLNAVLQLFKDLKIDLSEAFGIKDYRFISLSDLRNRLHAWSDRREEVHAWCEYNRTLGEINESRLHELGKQAQSGEADPNQIPQSFEMAYFEAIIKKSYDQHESIRNFSGSSFEQVREKFCDLDEKRIELARIVVAQAHYQGISRSSIGVGEVSILDHEFQKKRRHMPIRKLLKNAGHYIQSIKPVFMMSPLSISQFLEPDAIDFDLLLIDEASQVRPSDALGAMARTKQVVVVGDNKQMPPTSFFSRTVESGDSEDDEELRITRDLESILGLCCARGIPQRMLSWHYRSRHHSLIAVSNREFYNDRLFVIPSPRKKDPRYGLRFHFVDNGVYQNQVNEIEAKRVADDVMQHAEHNPKKSLGVGTFSIKQYNAILDELELRRRERPDLEHFFSTEQEEPFFVKNLENIQGDERDIILISVGYGPDPSGVFRMNFGPLGKEGGERRLNVLITRSRELCIVYSSFTSEQIDLRRAKSVGVSAFKTFLQYAETGNFPASQITGKDFDSEFERQVAHAVRAHGYEVDPQVGVAGFFIDLGVVDPDNRDRHIIGIECDGASYHSSRSARDRDRLRQSVLESLGWTIYRIWSTDWFNQPEKQTKLLIEAIQNAISKAREEDQYQEQCDTFNSNLNPSRASEEHSSEQSPVVKTVARTVIKDVEKRPKDTIETIHYQEATINLSHLPDIDRIPINTLAESVSQVVAAEGPIHHEEVVQRIRSLLGLQRTTKRVKNTVGNAIQHAVQKKYFIREDSEFYTPSSRVGEYPIRDRSNASASLRLPDRLPPREIRLAIMETITHAVGVSREDLVAAVCRLFGFKRTGSDLSTVISREIDSLIQSRELKEKNNHLYSN